MEAEARVGKRGQGVRDWRGIVLVAVLSLVAVAIIAWFAAHGGGPDKEVIAKWGGFVTTTGIVFGLAMKYHYKRSKRRLSFWLLVCALLLIHLLTGTWVLTRVTDWRMAWWTPITVLESIALDFILRVASRKLV